MPRVRQFYALSEPTMPAKRLLRFLILIQIPLLVGISVVAYLSFPSLPESLRYLAMNKDSIVPGATILEGAGTVAFLIANICVYAFWSGAPAFYLVITIILPFMAIYLGPFANNGWTDLFDTSFTMLNGIILGLIYFSPAHALFQRPEARPGSSSLPEAAVPRFAVGETTAESFPAGRPAPRFRTPKARSAELAAPADRQENSARNAVNPWWRGINVHAVALN